MPVEELSALALLQAAAVLLVEALVDQYVVRITGVCRMRMITSIQKVNRFGELLGVALLATRLETSPAMHLLKTPDRTPN